MPSFIILTAEEADLVRGPSDSTPSAALVPIERHGGVYVLGAGVLDDPAHAAHRDALAALPTLDSASPSFPAEETGD